jgi:hypothetical protein
MTTVYSMNVLVRAKRGEKGRRRPRASVLHPFPRPDDRATQAEAAAPARTAEARAAAPGRSRRDHLPLQDNALYTCHCGFVFEAAVCTTVDCPHCGTGQAW